MDGGGKNELG